MYVTVVVTLPTIAQSRNQESPGYLFTFCRVYYGFGHLRLTGQSPGSVPELTFDSRMGAPDQLFTLYRLKKKLIHNSNYKQIKSDKTVDDLGLTPETIPEINFQDKTPI